MSSKAPPLLLLTIALPILAGCALTNSDMETNDESDVEQTLELMAHTPYVVYQSSGDGHVIAFTDDPNYRAMYPALQRLFFNAVMFGPGH